MHQTVYCKLYWSETSNWAQMFQSPHQLESVNESLHLKCLLVLTSSAFTFTSLLFSRDGMSTAPGAGGVLINTQPVCLAPVRPLNSNKRAMLVVALTSSGCQNSSACYVVFLNASLSLSHRQTFTFQRTYTTFPYLFLHTLSYKEGRR